MREEVINIKHEKLRPGRPKIRFDLKTIIALRESGRSIREIAREVNISKSKVQVILKQNN